MVPNFALDLSEDGIVLMHRLADGSGWETVAEVSLDSPDLAILLKGLKAQAEALEGTEFTTKLILPPSQLLYANIPVGHDVQGDVERALEARTPYAIDDLSYDIRGTSPEVQVVAVARETLREAEGFIEPYGLNAVGFTASPDQTLFPGEPNLGLTTLGETMGFEPDLDPVAPRDPEAEEEVEAAEAVEAEAGDKDTRDDPADEELAASEETSDEAPQAEPEDESDPEPESEPEEVTAAAEEPEEEAGLSAPAAFSSRRRSPEADPKVTGERVTKLSARMSIPDKAPKLAGAKPKPLSVQPPAPTVKVPPPLSETSRPVPPPVIPAPRKEAAAEAPSSPGKLAGAGSAIAARMAARKEKRNEAEATEPDPVIGLAVQQVGGKPRRLGLMLTLALLIALGLFAVLSSFIVPEGSVARMLEREEEAVSVEPEVEAPAIADEEAADLELASLPAETFDQTAPGFALPQDEPDQTGGVTFEVLPPAQMTLDDAETAYALSGIWQKAPELDNAIATRSLDDLYIASLDPDVEFQDAPALASFPAESDDVLLVNPVAPPPPDLRFAFDERGLIRPSVGGSVNPEGVLIYLGKPPVEAIPRPENLIPEPEAEVDDRLAGIRPAPRPDDLVETQERATLGGFSREELARVRPVQRPQSAQAQAEAQAEAIAQALAEAEESAPEEADPFASATRLAVASSVEPAARPRNFNRVVTAARRAQERAAQRASRQESAAVQTASASTAAAPSRGSGPAVARSSRTNPTGPTRAAVARAATDNNALALGRVSLIGVFGTASNRRALVRMPNGRFKKVSVGDRVDGGRVAAIGSDQLRYTKGGRTVTLKMPKG